MANLSLLSHFAASTCAKTFFGFLPWDYYLSHDTSCQVNRFILLGSSSDIILILLALLDDLFIAAGLLAVIFVIAAGVEYIFSSGAPDKTAKALTTGINALVGLGISLVAIGVVRFIGTQFDNQRAGTVGQHLDLSTLPNPGGLAGAGFIQTALGIAFGIIGALAFLMIIIAGMQYVLAQGEPKATAQAKNTIIYAIVGLVLVVLAQSIVSLAFKAATG